MLTGEGYFRPMKINFLKSSKETSMWGWLDDQSIRVNSICTFVKVQSCLMLPEVVRSYKEAGVESQGLNAYDF